VDDDLGALTAAWIAAGLYDPADSRAGDRLELLRWLHERGITLQQMKETRRRSASSTPSAETSPCAPARD
jgi:hypothetical protein